jgi:aspartyl/asparaginyl-tRNA synthetase
LAEHHVSPEPYDLNTESEKKLGELYPDTLVMVHDWPYLGRGFYIMPKSGEGEDKVTRGFDCIYRGMNYFWRSKSSYSRTFGKSA